MLMYDMLSKRFLGMVLCCFIAPLTQAAQWQNDTVDYESSMMQSWANMPNADRLDGFAGDSTKQYLPVSFSLRDISKAYRLMTGESLSVSEEQNNSTDLEDTMQYNVEMISGGGVRMNLQFRF